MPIWPDTDRIPVWFWLVLVACMFAVGLWASTPDFDGELAMERVRQGIALMLLVGGLLWAWWGGRVLWRIRALGVYGTGGEAEVTRHWSARQRVRRSGRFETGNAWTTQHFIAYRFAHPSGETACPRMRIDPHLWQSLRVGRRMPIVYLADRPAVSRPACLALGPVVFTRGLQFLAGMGLAMWSAIGLAPGTLW